MSAIGERLKLARSMARLSQQELAERAGVSKMAISKYEANQMMPGSDVLLKLADALDIRMEFLLRQAPQLNIQPTYRKRVRMAAKVKEAIVAEIQEWLERYLAVEAFFPDEEIRTYSEPDGFPYPVASLDDAEQAAEKLRDAWQLGSDPIENLTELLEAHGIKVGLVKGDDDFDACTFCVNDTIPVIAIKQGIPGDRERFSLAHELGHSMLKVAPDVDEEKAANRFAGAFLAPARAVLMELGQTRHSLDPYELLLLKQKYGMSMAAWIYRAKDLGILSENDAQTMWQTFRVRGWHKQEPGEQMETEEPTRLRRLVRRLIAEDVISRSREAELLGERIALGLKQQEEALALHY
jgi:Zn-dependent peptidase ImmA (M78 family)/DNA-binding XRE family transcriptional regulator